MNAYDYVSRKETSGHLNDLDVGLIPWSDTNSSINQVFDVEENGVVVLGAGGVDHGAPLV